MHGFQEISAELYVMAVVHDGKCAFEDWVVTVRQDVDAGPANVRPIPSIRLHPSSTLVDAMLVSVDRLPVFGVAGRGEICDPRTLRDDIMIRCQAQPDALVRRCYGEIDVKVREGMDAVAWSANYSFVNREDGAQRPSTPRMGCKAERSVGHSQSTS